MPIYQYHCASCAQDLEIFQHMTDPSLTTCPQCQGNLRKVFTPVGIVFKGSGFYATDSKKSSAAVSPPAVPAPVTPPAGEAGKAKDAAVAGSTAVPAPAPAPAASPPSTD